ncbi:MAG: hypothetical protein AB8B69_00655 [Chitinophagales bacterium]
MSKKDNNTSKSFTSWTQVEVEKQFNLNLELTHPVLNEWLEAEEPITDFENQALDRLRQKAFVYVRAWNETELTAKLISAIFDLVDFDQIKYSLFLERPISGIINDIAIHGKADMIIATGRDIPESPYYFLQEFKKEKANSGDPVAQMLLAMLLAQQQNDNAKPLYGSYINGRMWFFSVLVGNTYSLSDSYIVTHMDDLQQILRMLKRLKKKIEESLKI